MILFIVFPFLGFYLGMQYQQKVIVTTSVQSEVKKTAIPVPTISNSANLDNGVKNESDKEQIQRVSTAYLHRFQVATQTDLSSFTSNEPTEINGKFAIQYYCGQGDCSQLWLKKIGGSWIVLGQGIDIGPSIDSYYKDYGWPLGFTK